MEVLVRQISERENERVVLECVEMTKDFEDIRDYVHMKGNTLVGYIDAKAFTLKLSDVLYFEAVGERVFAYTSKEIYQIKMRLYELEEQYDRKKFARVSKSVLVNLTRIESFHPTLGARILVRMDNGEEVVISRMFAKELKTKIMGTV